MGGLGDKEAEEVDPKTIPKNKHHYNIGKTNERVNEIGVPYNP
jgi:hypothetical protein